MFDIKCKKPVSKLAVDLSDNHDLITRKSTLVQHSFKATERRRMLSLQGEMITIPSYLLGLCV